MFDTSGAVAGGWALPEGIPGIFSETFAATMIGLVVVIVFGIQKFNEPTFATSEEQPETLLPPRFLALPRQYVNALLFYLGSLCLLFVLCSLAGSKGFGDFLAVTPIKPEAFPLAMALVIVGFIPNVKWIQQIELFFRRTAHRRAFIPDGARSMQARLRGAKFNFAKFNNDTILKGETFRGVVASDFTARSDTVEHRWARFSCLIYALDQLDQRDGDVADDFSNIAQDLDDTFLDANRLEYKRLLARHKELRPRIASYRKNMLSESETDDLNDSLQQTLRRAYVFIGCAVRLKYPIDGRAIDALAHFGFEVKPLPRPPSIFYVIRWAALAMPSLIFLAVLATQFFGLEVSQGNMNLQQTAVIWALSSIMVHGCAAWAAYKLRAHLQLTSEWTGTPRQIITAGIVGGFAGFLVLMPLDLMFGPNAAGFKEVFRVLPWLLLLGTTGAFTAYFLDTPIRAERGRREREAAIQGCVTALVTYLVLTAAPESVQPDGQLPATMEAFIIFITLIIGASLGFFLPHCHRQFERVRSGEVESRIEDVRWEAGRVFHDQPKADAWLNQPNASLRGATPIAAAKSAAGGDRVRSLLLEMGGENPAKTSRTRRFEPRRWSGRGARGFRSDLRETTAAAATGTDGGSANGQHPAAGSPVAAPVGLGH
jgi:hypothetical protein